METKPSSMEKLEKVLIWAKIFSLIAVPLLVAVIGYFTQKEVEQINENLNWKNHDFLIVQEFNNTFYDKDKRRVALQTLKLLHDEKTEKEIRKGVIWWLLEKNITEPQKNGEAFVFNPSELDWHYLGENLCDLIKLDKQEGINYYKSVREAAMTKGNYHPSVDSSDFEKVFEWIESPERIKCINKTTIE